MAKPPQHRPADVAACLKRLGFVEKTHRGKGDHRMFFRTAQCRDGEVGLVVLLDFGRDPVPGPILRKILTDIGLDLATFDKVYRKRWGQRGYDAMLSNRSRSELLPKHLRG
ncbi:MAG: hypothetical protein COY42_29705 [Armatimonadetes bacterium CG_4_10_14_0_8_um_filter_66_14]|nr:hypothetical protein [Armatimonadota bacterium]NCQ30823.1 hypothetical protein [Armatimonadota bacterium]NDK17080.1 hypothetical protein [Armatimonadota bacterium]PIX50030.1 MAG: hypothetical protein COZ57_01030 [Armatimonadetes bacterium CG_4_8_14_3_um_filter_66_20]PIZ33675.1 MAG: hypothetical protein COY42_29705 [Armatimonadetes bacterium CG_4_10_14_0_8_um_filter_66_14]